MRSTVAAGVLLGIAGYAANASDSRLSHRSSNDASTIDRARRDRRRTPGRPASARELLTWLTSFRLKTDDAAAFLSRSGSRQPHGARTDRERVEFEFEI